MLVNLKRKVDPVLMRNHTVHRRWEKRPELERGNFATLHLSPETPKRESTPGSKRIKPIRSGILAGEWEPSYRKEKRDTTLQHYSAKEF